MDLTTYLQGLSDAKRQPLYDSPWTCQALLRSLPSLAQQYVLRLLYVESPFESKYVSNWIKPEYQSSHQSALDTLRHLGLLRDTKTEAGEAAFRLHKSFQKNLRLALCNSGSTDAQVGGDVLRRTPDAAALDAHAKRQWEALLMFLVNGKHRPPAMPPYLKFKALDVAALLTSAGLLCADSGAGRVSELGFQFLLLDSFHQLWTLLHAYISNARDQEDGSELSSALSFLLQLGFRRVGQAVAWSALSTAEARMAAHAAQLGLVCTFQVGGSTFFCPTRLAASLCGGYAGGGGSAGGAADSVSADLAGGHIVVETNYRVNAYTSSPVAGAVLGLFVRVDCVLPNMVVGTLTRDSVGSALAAGISADQLVDYLRAHAHPSVMARSPVVPEVVSDQIRLWEADARRVRLTPAVLYDQFDTAELFSASLAHARRRGWVMWHDSERRRFLAKWEGHEEMRRFIREAKGGPPPPHAQDHH